MSKYLRFIVLAALVPALASCASVQAKTPASVPPLDVPPPPPHVIAPASELPSMPEPVGELPPPAAGQPNRQPRPTPAKPPANEPKAEAKPGEVKPPETAPVEQPKEAPKPPEPAPQLATPQTADTAAAANAVHATMDRALGLLNTIDYRTLSRERKKAYDDAKMFLQNADKALKHNNVQEAQGLANKAETLAHELAGR